MTTAQIQAVMIFSAIVCGVISSGYLYQSVIGIFSPALRTALRSIALGLVCLTFGVLIASLIIFSSELGVSITAYANILSAGFYSLYIIGSLLIFMGARKFANRPAQKVPDVSLQTIK